MQYVSREKILEIADSALHGQSDLSFDIGCRYPILYAVTSSQDDNFQNIIRIRIVSGGMKGPHVGFFLRTTQYRNMSPLRLFNTHCISMIYTVSIC